MSTKKAAKGKKLSVKKEKVKDLPVSTNKSGSVKGGVGKLSQPRTACDPGCNPC